LKLIATVKVSCIALMQGQINVLMQTKTAQKTRIVKMQLQCIHV